MTLNRNGKKTEELLDIMECTPEWGNYVTNKAKLVLTTLYKTKSMSDTLVELNMKYNTARSHMIRGLERIKNKKKNHLRNGRSEKAEELFNLMENKNWKNNLTVKEIELAELFRQHKNFYRIAEIKDLSPGNIAGTLYGNSQKPGVVGKIKSK